METKRRACGFAVTNCGEHRTHGDSVQQAGLAVDLEPEKGPYPHFPSLSHFTPSTPLTKKARGSWSRRGCEPGRPEMPEARFPSLQGWLRPCRPCGLRHDPPLS